MATSVKVEQPGRLLRAGSDFQRICPGQSVNREIDSSTEIPCQETSKRSWRVANRALASDLSCVGSLRNIQRLTTCQLSRCFKRGHVFGVSPLCETLFLGVLWQMVPVRRGGLPSVCYLGLMGCSDSKRERSWMSNLAGFGWTPPKLWCSFAFHFKRPRKKDALKEETQLARFQPFK